VRPPHGPRSRRRFDVRPWALIGALGCAAPIGSEQPQSPYAAAVVYFEPGDNAGYGQDDLPDVVLGAPTGKGSGAGSTDVLSLGLGGEIVLDFGRCTLVDEAGPDLLVFENPFWPGGNPDAVFAELGEVAVSADGERFESFPCQTEAPEPGRYPGCAGVTPTLDFDPATPSPLDPELTGGDAFDLADVGLSEARYVRIRDLAAPIDASDAPSAGFDLDAVAAINCRWR